MTGATIAMLHAQGDPVEVADEWSWEDGADPDLWMYRGRTLAQWDDRRRCWDGSSSGRGLRRTACRRLRTR
jgi:hypothetical protein